MPRTGKPGNPGNRTLRRGKPPERKVVIDMELARQLRTLAPDIDLATLVRTLLVKFLIDLKQPESAAPDAD